MLVEAYRPEGFARSLLFPAGAGVPFRTSRVPTSALWSLTVDTSGVQVFTIRTSWISPARSPSRSVGRERLDEPSGSVFATGVRGCLPTAAPLAGGPSALASGGLLAFTPPRLPTLMTMVLAVFTSSLLTSSSLLRRFVVA